MDSQIKELNANVAKLVELNNKLITHEIRSRFWHLFTYVGAFLAGGAFATLLILMVK